MSDYSSNKRLAKNTLLLYGRMVLLMLVSLYTSRVILKALGVVDYGIYNVVGGVVSMFSILSASLSASISRYITIELGKGNKESLQRVFCTSITVQIILILIIVLLLETIGLWFLNYKMEIPENRIIAANWVFQFSVISFAINLWSVPYNSIIIAHEKMSAFAFVSIFEALAKLFVAFLVSLNPIDRLIYYSVLTFLVSLIVRFIYSIYCKLHFEECSYNFTFDKELTKQMFDFAGWSFWGSGSWLLMNQGVNILINVFFGVVINAARGIAVQVDQAVIQFVNSFTTAINPQITKSYARGEIDHMFSLVLKGAKFSYFLVLVFAVPIICEADFILKMWLGNIPSHTTNFVRFSLVISLIHVLSNSMITAILANGDIKKYQIIVGGIGMLVFPVSWICFYIGLVPETTYIVNIGVFIIQLIARLLLMKEKMQMSINTFLIEVIMKTSIVTFSSFILPILIILFIDDNVIRFLLVIFVSTTSVIISVYLFGLTKCERNIIFNKTNNILQGKL